MLPLTEEALRASFVNASLRERQNLSVPSNFGDLDWNSLDFLAWRDRNTIGTLACARFQCAVNARKRPAAAYIGFDVEAARQRRIEVLRERVHSLARDIRDGR